MYYMRPAQPRENRFSLWEKVNAGQEDISPLDSAGEKVRHYSFLSILFIREFGGISGFIFKLEEIDMD